MKENELPLEKNVVFYIPRKEGVINAWWEVGYVEKNGDEYVQVMIDGQSLEHQRKKIEESEVNEMVSEKRAFPFDRPPGNVTLRKRIFVNSSGKLFFASNDDPEYDRYKVYLGEAEGMKFLQKKD